MPLKLKRLSGIEVITILEKFDFEIHSQRGSHIKLRRNISTKEKQTLTIPNHKEIDIGTLKAIVRQAGRFIPENSFRDEFYSE